MQPLKPWETGSWHWWHERRMEMAKVSFRRRVEVLEQRQSAPRPPRSVQFDEDALRLYDMAFELHGRVQPDWRSIKEAPIGVRGKELRLQKYGPIIPAHEDPAWSRWTQASSEFELCFNREPIAGDLLRWEHVRTMHGPEVNEIKFGDQIEAWQRQLPHLPCPLKFEAGCLFKRQSNGDWFEAVDVSWKARWWGVECDARGAPGDWAYGIHPELWSDPDPNPLARMPSMGAVTFLGLVDGKNACRPATYDELRRPETDELFREIWCSEPKTDPPSGRAWVRDKRNGFYGTIPVENLASATEGSDAEYTKCDCVATERVKDP